MYLEGRFFLAFLGRGGRAAPEPVVVVVVGATGRTVVVIAVEKEGAGSFRSSSWSGTAGSFRSPSGMVLLLV